MSNREIIVNNLVKRYKDFVAVKGISLKVKNGEIYGFLGPNGAGKSTTVAILTTLSLPTEGTATVGGFDLSAQAADVRQIAGVALQEIGLDPLMKGPELLMLQARLFGMNGKQARARTGELLELVKLNDAKTLDRRVGKYSGGMRRRLDLALALIHQPQILFLDEPTTGLDPASRRDIWAEVRRLNQQFGITIFLTTQYLEEADELADRVAIINAGQIAVEGTPDELKSQMGAESINVTFRTTEAAQLARTVIAKMTNMRTQLDETVVRLYIAAAAAAVPDVVMQLQSAGLEIASLTLTQPTLDDVFLKVTGQRFKVSDEQAEKPQAGRPSFAA